jgi:hypothetical protein
MDKQNLSTKERIQKTSHVIAVLLKIAQIMCFVAGGIVIGGMIYITLFGNTPILKVTGHVVVRSPFSSSFLAKYNTKDLLTMCSCLLFSLLFTLLMLKQAFKIFSDISTEATPFNPAHIKRIRKMAIFYLLAACNNVEGSAGANFDITPNVIGIVGAAMLWCIALIFQYGCELQKESDETL